MRLGASFACARKVLRPSSPPLRGRASPQGEATKRLTILYRQEEKPVCKAVIKISNADAAVRYETPCGHVKERQGCKAVIKISNAYATVRNETPCGHVKERQGCKAVIKISNADATVRYETPCGRVKIVQETNKSENK